MASIPVPDLTIKLKKLYASGRNSEITSLKQLADKLNISPEAIENWMYSSGGMKGGIPSKHINIICQLFNLRLDDLKSNDLGYFDNCLKRPVSGWSRLFQRAEAQHQNGCLNLFKHRGIIVPYDDNDDVEGDCLGLDEPLHLKLEGMAGWHVVSFIRDPDEVMCLCPNRKYRNYQFPAEGKLTLPPENMKPLLTTTPTGQHWVLSIFTKLPLPTVLQQAFNDHLNANCEKLIDDLERWVEKEQHFVLKLPFYVCE